MSKNDYTRDVEVAVPYRIPMGKFVGGNVSAPRIFCFPSRLFFILGAPCLVDAYDCCVHYHSFVLQYIYIAIGWWVHETAT